MTPPRYDRQELAPLLTQTDIEERVTALIGRAARRQVWFLFVDDRGEQLPLLLPIEDHPTRPDSEDPDRFAALLDEVAEGTDAHGVIVVIERFRDAELTRGDRAWAAALHEAATRSVLTARGVLLSHAKGVRWIAADDYLRPAR